MKRIIKLTYKGSAVHMPLKPFLLFALLMISVSASSQVIVKLIAETNHSTVQFVVPISSGLTRITGKFKDYQIYLDYVDNDITKSMLIAVIKTASVDTGIPARDEDLRGATFFNVEKYPEIKFTSASIIKDGSGYIAAGTLDFQGVSKEIKLPFTITGTHGDNVIGFTSRYTLKRSDYNFATTFKHTTDDHFIGEEIGVEIDFWTKRPKK